MFKKDVQPLPDSMVQGITATIDKLTGYERNDAQEEAPAVEVEQQDVQESYKKKMKESEVCPECGEDPCCCDDEDEDEMEESSCGKKHTKEEKELDPVNKKAVKKDFDDRKDKDIDNDGDVDSSDKYLHMRRKAITKALAKEEKLDEKMSDAEKKTARSLMRLGDKPRQAIKTAKGQKSKDKEFYRKAYEEVEQVEEAYKTPAEAKAYEAGKKAWRDKKKYDTNPNKKGTPEHTAWSKGHNDARAKFVKKYGSNEEKMRYESVELDEARKNQADELYFDTYSAAVQYAKAKAEKMGYAVDEDDWHNQITTGPGKPGRGKTVRHTLKLTKGGKPVRKGLAIQVYNRETDKKTYELNSYVS